MIYDTFQNASRYRGLSPRFARAFDYLLQTDIVAQPDGRVDLIPGEVWATIMRKPARTAAVAQFEYHRRYADIQCCVEGSEQMGWHPDLAGLQEAKAYDGEKEAGMMHGPIRDFVPLHAGRFAIFFPNEPHAPMIGEGMLTKVVLKVLAS